MPATYIIQKPLLLLLIGGLLSLSICCGYLLKEKIALKAKAKILILQNDSILAVNIELKDSLSRTMQTGKPRSPSFVFKSVKAK